MGIILVVGSWLDFENAHLSWKCAFNVHLTRLSNPHIMGLTIGLLYIYPGIIAIDQSHRYGHHQAACREPAGSYDKTTRTAICFEHKTQYLLIHAPYTRIVVCWHISNIPPMISSSQITCNTHTFYIAAIFVKYCNITGSWLLKAQSHCPKFA